MENIRLSESGSSVIILDQSLLPAEEKYIELKTPEEMHEAIEKLRVRGAPAIGIFAAYAMAALAHQMLKYKPISGCCSASGTSDDVFMQEMSVKGDYLKASRPTAVNPAWAVDRVLHAARVEMYKARQADPNRMNVNAGVARLAEAVRREAFAIQEEDKAMCRAIAEHGLNEVIQLGGKKRKEEYKEDYQESDSIGILTHCNAGPLATSEYGTALGPVLLGAEEGVKFRVFADETRPLLQGARLTAYELQKAGVDVTLICDNMASSVMKRGWVQAVFVGCDRIAANGDTANKIGTSGVAILAKHYGIPFYVLGPSSTIDPACATGADIPIEERDGDEIREKFYAKPVAPEGIKCFNPAFDVTEHELITAIITEKGVFRPPYSF
ncbi:MAG: S-methyl-5-thioribose-1-phosphate isomerase [Bacillota bacterium]|nr:S-methyl-5-thioribose-1-phosphate isomerase [Bacillota bacterium]